jgi:SAM-dependent methyltransferase
MERIGTNTSLSTRRYHVARYEFARALAINKRVLDVACGNGYGSVILSEVADNVVSVDPKSEISYAVPHFIRSYAEDLTFTKEFDLVVSFETLEHAVSPELFLYKIWVSLKDRGTLLLSFPNNWGETRYHLHNTSWSTIELVRRYFHVESIYGQNRVSHIEPVGVSGGEGWVENIILMATKNIQAEPLQNAFEHVYAVVERKQKLLASSSFAWLLRQLPPRVTTILKRRGLWRR